MEIESVQLPFGQPITEAYVRRTRPEVESLFGSHPAEDTDWKRRAQWLKDQSANRVSAEQLATTLTRYNQRFNDSDEVKLAIEAIGNGAPVVVGGQQAGLWTGPLLVIHKAISVIAAARHAAELTGQIVIPLFWIAGEDHDWDEANHTLIVNQENQLVKIAIERPKGNRTSVSRTKLQQEAMLEAVKKLGETLPDSEYKRDLIASLTSFAKLSDNLSEWFAYTMGWLFGKQGLVLMDSDDPALRKLEGPLFKRMIERNDELEEAYQCGADHIRELGFVPQADVVTGSANVFLFQDDQGSAVGERTLLYKRDGRFENRKGTVAWEKEELLRIANESPERLSNNVLTRPLMQDYVLPVLAAVLGPGEIAYWALTGAAFRSFDMQMPIIVPRMSFTLVEAAVTKHMMKYELTFENVVNRFAEYKEAWLNGQDRYNIEARFDEVKQQFAELYQPIMDLVATVEGGLSALSETNKQKIMDQIAFLQTRTKEAHARQFDASLRQLDRIAVSIWPDGKPQERVVNVTVFWNRFGRSWLDRLLEVPFDCLGSHRIIYL
ncbi:putative cysteine ligase BshC [Paenibacillus baekrokdamisoli]|uniref:Putative cysteine ligase BshC n=1 Tax=Paenibacillus baekrokdamisoli TaxID=1712516 RepID=A0A3G9IS61_9BACL|nr:bacillithiol biosynthesis cysteine-adding enzyme BshC [Paenibacillus baekrokdamisoli]MBB3070231.1 bacillithiol biosynthesis cysteine-adding enzyme BshC [Paenibacillus baekrokdamisoli]BBH21236.1 putative cysteine ligase BshC [Paenibacillus baekrokdamisoli]